MRARFHTAQLHFLGKLTCELVIQKADAALEKTLNLLSGFEQKYPKIKAQFFDSNSKRTVKFLASPNNADNASLFGLAK